MRLNGKLIWYKKKKSRKAAGEQQQQKAGKGREGNHRGDVCRVTALPKTTWWGKATTVTANTRDPVQTTSHIY